MRGGAGERGSGSVLVLGVVAAVLVVLTATLVLSGALSAAHRSRGAADLSALAAAGEAVDGASPAAACGVAEDLARANGARLRSCVVGPDGVADVDVVVAVPVHVAGITPRAMPGRARAGPAPGQR
ncbi:hypothetical protein EEW87_002425 [Janibacter melonis]|uniref:Putative Flp pilus-assembly TadG-like N-terminal domain-containing protein n=1 Tax=Janibacter melonis TaxID=262209 RepID=A0A5P8FJH1_9MICO|nr:Rv3654c family TadE-like protein [Janibacter melonis]QFQ29428.2 hypothetical protein EEW87_002425 [Janibacter melonis]